MGINSRELIRQDRSLSLAEAWIPFYNTRLRGYGGLGVPALCTWQTRKSRGNLVLAS